MEPKGVPMADVLDSTLSSRVYDVLRKLIYDHSKIQLGAQKQSLLANRLRQRLAVLGGDSFEGYCDLLQSSQGKDEITHLVDLISTNHTSFFREPEHFAFLSKNILPALVTRLAREGRPLQIWSCATSSGEEAYSLAIVLAEFLRAWPSVTWQVVASDISHRMLAKARQGIYRADFLAAVPPDLLKLYFQRGIGPQEGNCRIRPELSQHVRFVHINLFQSSYPVSMELDVIFCRNVMIYFDPPSRAHLIDRIKAQMASGGHLFVGKSETLFGIPHGLASVQQGTYRKP